MVVNRLLFFALLLVVAGVFASCNRKSPVPANAVVVEQVTFTGHRYTVACVESPLKNLKLFWKRSDGTRLGSFENLQTNLAGKHLLFATNAGIFDTRWLFVC